MVSAAEQLAANINWSAFGKAEELKKRIYFTLGALIIYRLGTYIPLPGIDPSVFEKSFTGNRQGVLELFNMFAGGAVQRMAIFALNIMPYISASIIIQMLTSVFPTLEALKKEGESGRKVINQYTRYLTVVLAAFQAYGISVGLEGQAGVVLEPGLFFRISTVLTLMGGTMFLMWLGEQITSRGIGNGSSLIIFAGIVAAFPSAIVNTLELGRQGAISTGLIIAVMAMSVGVVAFIVFMERAQRRLLITYPKRQQGNKVYEGQTSFLPLKLNTSGVIPPIFASSLLLLPVTIANFSQSQGGTGVLATITTYLGHGRPLYMIAYVGLIVFFAFLLHRHCLQSHGDGRQSQETRRVHPGDKTGRAHGAIYRYDPDAHHGDRCSLSCHYLSSAGNADLLCGASILFRWNLSPYRGQCHHGYGGSDNGPSAGSSI